MSISDYMPSVHDCRNFKFSIVKVSVRISIIRVSVKVSVRISIIRVSVKVNVIENVKFLQLCSKPLSLFLKRHNSSFLNDGLLKT